MSAGWVGGGDAQSSAPSTQQGLCQNVHFYTNDKIRFCVHLPAIEINLQLKAEL